MKPKQHIVNVLLATGLLMVNRPGLTAPSPNGGYVQHNLISDIATNAPHADARLVNPWGIVAGPDSVWVNDNGTGLMTIYGPFGQVYRYAVHIPAPGGGTGTPTGLAFNGTSGFVLTRGNARATSTFLMSTEDGTITAWNERITGTNAAIVVDNSGSGAVYKGLDLARSTSGNPQIYAANFHAGFVDIFDSSFQYVSSFTDSNLPPNFAPFNVHHIRGYLMVSFALQNLPKAHDDQSGPGNGFIDIFDVDGTLLRRFASQGALNSPWGMAVAPDNFGRFSEALLVGNFGDGKINAYDLLTGKWLGNLTRSTGENLVINGLWGLAFQRSSWEDRRNFPVPRLYFAAGLNDEADGLMGFINPLDPRFPPAH